MSSRRFRLRDASLEVERTTFRGQWGIAQDDAGRLFYNHNSHFLYGDEIPAEYALRQPATATRLAKPGVNVGLAEDELVYGVRVAPGLDRAYLPGVLRRDGRQAGPTAASGVAIQRGDQYGPEWVGDAFVPEAAGAAVAHFAVQREGTALRAEHQLYADDTWGSREFLASTDERFRPVDAEFGPDGAIWVIDMYRGVITHADFVSDYLRDYVAKQGLEPPGETGRIWRIVREDRPITRRPPPLDTLERQLSGLDHPNGWVRDRAQRRIADEASPEAAPALRRLDAFGPMGRSHALWALDRMDSLDAATWRRALEDPDPRVRSVALRVGETRFADSSLDAGHAITPLLEDPDPAVRLQALHTLGSLPVTARPVAALLDAGRSGDPLTVQAAISGLAGLELVALRAELERAGTAEPGASSRRWVESVAAAALTAAREGPDPDADVDRILDLVESLSVAWQAVALMEGIERAQRSPGGRLVELATPHPLFDPERASSSEVAASLARLRAHFIWPGDANPGGMRPLAPAERERRKRGRELFGKTCAACHGRDGRGLGTIAPPLAGSPWVRDSDDWLVRIALDGVTGPIRVGDAEWNLSMPGHRGDPRFDDDSLAGVLTHLRRSWGHVEDPVSPQTVARIRSETTTRTTPWTSRELLELPVEHRLDRFVGTYAVPVVGKRIVVQRRDTVLTAGGSPLYEVSGGSFVGKAMTIQFEIDESGVVEGASVLRDGLRIPVTKTD